MLDNQIKCLTDLNNLRSAPSLNRSQSNKLMKELISHMNNSDWFTLGIMTSSSKLAIFTLREIESYFNWSAMKVAEKPLEDGPVFLKANQKTGDIYVRIEHGLGEGILLSCQHDEISKNSSTFGPFPLDFFTVKD